MPKLDIFSIVVATSPQVMFVLMLTNSTEKYNECIDLAKRSLADPTLPRYYTIQNCLLVVAAEDDWYDADLYLRMAEQTWTMAHCAAKHVADDASLKVLDDLRTSLDRMYQARTEDAIETQNQHQPRNELPPVEEEEEEEYSGSEYSQNEEGEQMDDVDENEARTAKLSLVPMSSNTINQKQSFHLGVSNMDDIDSKNGEQDIDRSFEEDCEYFLAIAHALPDEKREEFMRRIDKCLKTAIATGEFHSESI
jgi:hypothetical protein